MKYLRSYVFIILLICLCSQDIHSIIAPRDEENSLMAAITEEEDDVDKDDVIVESWMKRIDEGHRIRIEEMCNQNVQARQGEESQNADHEEISGVDGPGIPTIVVVVEMIKDLKIGMIEQINKNFDMILGMEKRFEPLEECMEKQKAEKRKVRFCNTG